MGRLKPQPFRVVKRRLEAAGFLEESQKGSHVKFVRRVGEEIDIAVVPKKREIPVGTLRSILNQAHIEPGGLGRARLSPPHAAVTHTLRARRVRGLPNTAASGHSNIA